MSKWGLVAVLALQAHVAAASRVPLGAHSQGELGGPLRWRWPWASGDGGPRSRITPSTGFPIAGFFLGTAGGAPSSAPWPRPASGSRRRGGGPWVWTAFPEARSRGLCDELDGEVERFRNRQLEGPYPYMWLDATFVKVRHDGRVVSMAVVIAIGVRATGEREVLGLDMGPSEDGAFWLTFLRGLVGRGLRGSNW